MSMISIGTDTEIFARNNAGRAISLCGKIGGTKREPMPIQGLPEGFAVQEDNVSVEFNIPPAHSAHDFNLYIDVALKSLSTMLQSMNLYFSNDAAISFDKEQLTHPNALIFGCEPDYNAWTKMENTKPHCNDPSLRTAGGHIHVGTRENIISCVESMDLFLGVPSVLIDDEPASLARRNLYGKAGAMRPKPYGFEYRVLSNFWVFTERMRKWVYLNTARAVSSTLPSSTSLSSKIQECINTGNKSLAETLIKEFKIAMPEDVIISSQQPRQEVRKPSTSINWAVLSTGMQGTITESIIMDDLGS